MSIEQSNRSDGWSEVYMDSVTVLGDVREDLDDLRTDFSDSVVEQYGAKTDTQYYHLGKTTVEQGDIHKIHDAIDKGQHMTHAHISILGGADQLFMSEPRGQQVLDAEIAKLESGLASRTQFSPQNKAVVQSLIRELKDPAKHNDLARRFSRTDGRSNLGNARLIAARMASGYAEVLASLHTKIKSTGSDVLISLDVAWDKCVIGTSGPNLYDRKIDVSISIQMDTPVEEQTSSSNQQTNSGSSPQPSGGTTERSDTGADVARPTNVDPASSGPSDTQPDVMGAATEYLSDDVRMLVGTAFLQIRESHLSWQPPSDYRYGTGSTNPTSLWSSYDARGSESVVIYDAGGAKVFEVVLRKDAPPLVGLGSNMMPTEDVNQLLSVLDDIAQMDRDSFYAFLSTLRPSGSEQQAPVEAPNTAPASVEVQLGSKEIVLSFPSGTGDIVTAAGSPELFTKDAQGNYFPDIAKIQAYYDRQGLDVEFVVSSQTYENGRTLTDFALDNGKFAGEYQDLERLKQEKKGLLITYPDGRMEFTHTDEIQSWTKIPDGVDIAMLGSVKRPGKDINENLLGTSSPNRFLVQKTDGSVEILVLYGSKEEQKKTLSQSKYARILYLDVKGNRGQIDGYWAMLNNKLTYGNHELGDVLRDKKVPIQVVSGNMPSLLIMTKDKRYKQFM